MGDVGVEQKLKGGVDHAAHRPHFPAIRSRPGWKGEVGAEELIGTIEEVEEHEQDPRDPDPESDPWEEAGASWASLTGELRAKYHELVGEDGPTEEEIREAVRTLGAAAQSLVGSVGTAMSNPEVRTQVKDAASSLMTALTETFFGLADELKRAGSDDEGREPEGDDPP